MTEHLDVVIVGAGISGVSAAWHLQDRCPTKSYAILEKRESMGGTWDLFRYPGIRSDSDMYTLGFRFRPWTGRQAIADGKPILEYVKSTAAMYGIDRHIRFHHKVISADWWTAENRWTVHIQSHGTLSALTCEFLFLCSGYYNYDEGYSPRFAGSEDFVGPIIHPQHWPEDLDYDAKNIVVIGSGATAVTLVPALADSGAKHVTMLQRSPTYIVSQPDRDGIAEKLNRWLPETMAYTAVRWKNVLRQAAVYSALPEVATAHAEDVPEPDPAPATRGVRRAKALRPALQPLGPAIVLGAQRRPVPGHSSREGRGGDRHH